jgi:L-lactate dehydrogenase complex protein LldF
MKPMSHDFKARSEKALEDPVLQSALKNLGLGFVEARRQCANALPEFEALRDLGRDICDHTLANLDFYLRRYEEKVTEAGGQVHWASTPDDGCRIVTDICRNVDAKKVIRGKSMIGEEVGINDALEEAGFETVETDLGEYILQLAEEPPSHIVAPAIHKSKDEISDLFQKHHAVRGLTERQTERSALVQEARQVLREAFVSADVGITGPTRAMAISPAPCPRYISSPPPSTRSSRQSTTPWFCSAFWGGAPPGRKSPLTRLSPRDRSGRKTLTGPRNIT